MGALISIIVPIYKVEKEINRCVDSLLCQTYRNIQIILVDDGSPDSCPEICDQYAKQDDRILVIHKKNGGLSDARNAGINVANGEYLMFVDSDDYIDENACQHFIDATNNQKIDIIVGSAMVHKEDKIEFLSHNAINVGKIFTANEYIKKAIIEHEWYAPACFNMYRRGLFLENNLYYKKNIYFEDMEMLPRVFLAAKTITVSEGIFYHYVIRENSITTSIKNIKKEKDSIHILYQWKKIFDEVDEKDLKRYLYGMLIRCYLHECRVYKIKKWRIPDVDFKFALKYGIGIKEKIKAMLFALFPSLYVKL